MYRVIGTVTGEVDFDNYTKLMGIIYTTEAIQEVYKQLKAKHDEGKLILGNLNFQDIKPIDESEINLGIYSHSIKDINLTDDNRLLLEFNIYDTIQGNLLKTLIKLGVKISPVIRAESGLLNDGVNLVKQNYDNKICFLLDHNNLKVFNIDIKFDIKNDELENIVLNIPDNLKLQAYSVLNKNINKAVIDESNYKNNEEAKQELRNNYKEIQERLKLKNKTAKGILAFLGHVEYNTTVNK